MFMNFSAFVVFVTLLGIFIFLEKILHRITKKYLESTKSKLIHKVSDIGLYFLSLIKILAAFSIAFSFAVISESVS